MEKEETLVNNRLIAQFMGYEKIGYMWHQGNILISPKHIFDGDLTNSFKYHTSWDWLMPVVNKIKTISENWDFESLENEMFEEIFNIDNMFSEFLNNDSKAIFLRVLKFITWYNSQNK